MSYATSNDGTRIAYERTGSGPAVILVGGGLDDGAENAPLAPELAASYTVINYARRGRGGSGDTQPYALDREIEDVAALIAEAGDSAHLFGASSGGALALEAAAAGLPVDSVAMYEVPYPTSDEETHSWREYTAAVSKAIAEDRRGEALELFMRMAGSSDAEIAGARALPVWPDLETLAPTLPYDAACLGDGGPPPRLATITQPVLALTGSTGTAGPATDFFDRAASAVVDRIPHTERRVLAGQGHVAEPTVLAPVLAGFFAAAR